MCGIAGASLNPNEIVDTRVLVSALLLGIEERGQHATGAAWTDADGAVWVNKGAVPASVYVKEEHVPSDVKTFIAHTRWATKGAVENNDNNHPIDVGGIVGIHNGCIYNDDDLFEKIGAEKRIAQVDSEAIFANILHSAESTVENLQEVRGSAAVSWLETNDGHALHIARISSSPVVMGTTKLGSRVFASTERALKRAAGASGLEFTDITNLTEGTYLTLVDGKVTAYSNFATHGRRALSETEKKALNLI